MFAMLHGAWPLTPEEADGDERGRVVAAVRAQLDAGLELVTDGLVRWPDPAAALLDAIRDGDTGPDGMLVRAWRETADVAASLAAGDGPPPTVAAVLTGPYTLASATSNAAEATALALRLHDELLALAEAGCTLAVIDEPAAIGIGADQEARRRFREAQAVLLGDDPPLHAMLAITGGSAWEAGPETILDGALRVLPVRPHRGSRQLVPGPGRARATGASCARRCGRRRPVTRRRSSCGRPATRPPRTAAARIAWGWPTPRRSHAWTCRRRGRRSRRSPGPHGLAALDPGDAVAAGLDRRTFAQPPGRGARPRRLPRDGAVADERALVLVDDPGLGEHADDAPPPVAPAESPVPSMTRQPPAVPPCGRAIAASQLDRQSVEPSSQVNTLPTWNTRFRRRSDRRR